jgi:hypothetical protein
MRSMNLLQLLGGVAIAGVVAAGSTAAFTAGAGLKVSAASQWLGGTATHTVNGADITTVAYHYTSGSTFDYVDLTFADANGSGKAVTATAAGGAYSGGAALACQAITAGGLSRCEVQANTTYVGAPSGTYTGLQTLTITVA